MITMTAKVRGIKLKISHVLIIYQEELKKVNLQLLKKLNFKEKLKN